MHANMSVYPLDECNVGHGEARLRGRCNASDHKDVVVPVLQVDLYSHLPETSKTHTHMHTHIHAHSTDLHPLEFD